MREGYRGDGVARAGAGGGVGAVPLEGDVGVGDEHGPQAARGQRQVGAVRLGHRRQQPRLYLYACESRAKIERQANRGVPCAHNIGRWENGKIMWCDW